MSAVAICPDYPESIIYCSRGSETPGGNRAFLNASILCVWSIDSLFSDIQFQLHEIELFFQTCFPLKCWLYSHLWRLTGVIFRCHALEFQFALANQFMKADLEDYARSKDRDYFDVCNVCLRPTPPALLRLSGPRGTILRCIVCNNICDSYEFL